MRARLHPRCLARLGLAVRLLLGLVGLLLGGSPPAGAEARLDYRGLVLPARQVESLARRALRMPADSIALSRALGDIVGQLQNYGHLDARAHGQWEGRTLRIEVDEGLRYRLDRVAVHAPSAEESLRFARLLGLRSGDWASPQAVGNAVDRAVRTVADRGYPYAVLGVSGWDSESDAVQVALTGSLGPHVTIARVRVLGLQATRPELAERAMGRLMGRPYQRAAAEAARERLIQLGLFRSVTFEGLEGEGDWSRGHLVYRVEEPRYHRFEGTLGIQGEAGPVGLLRLDLDNLVGTGRALGLRWESRGPGIVHLGARYAEPLLLGAPLRLEGAFDQQVQDTIFVRTRWGMRARYALSGQERLEAGYEQERVVQERLEVEQAQLQNTLFALERSALEPPLEPRRGSRVRIEATQTFKKERLRPAGSRSARASAVEIHGEWHRSLRPRSGLALEIRSAARFSSQRVLPFFERYALGGGRSLRGHDEEAFRVDRFVLTRFEWRWFLGADAQRVFLFWDHATSATRIPIADGDRLQIGNRDGFGFGLRLPAAGSLVGLDYGWSPGATPLEGKIHVQLVSTF